MAVSEAMQRVREYFVPVGSPEAALVELVEAVRADERARLAAGGEQAICQAVDIYGAAERGLMFPGQYKADLLARIMAQREQQAEQIHLHERTIDRQAEVIGTLQRANQDVLERALRWCWEQWVNDDGLDGFITEGNFVNRGLATLKEQP
jgi:hypothetical protein